MKGFQSLNKKNSKKMELVLPRVYYGRRKSYIIYLAKSYSPSS
jgi:hypothetical protein